METPEFFQTSHFSAQFATEKRLVDPKNVDHFIIEDLLDFPSDEGMVGADAGFEAAAAMTRASTDSSLVNNSCNSSFSDLQAAGIGGPGDVGQFASQLCVPYDDMAELEWLSNIVDESFCSEDLQRLHLIQPQGMKARANEPPEAHQYEFQPENIVASPGPTLPSEMLVPAKARSKRSRAAPGNWTSRLLALSPTATAVTTVVAPVMSSSSESEVSAAAAAGKKPVVAHKKKEGAPVENAGDGRRCLHCATDKTPQWRTGPMGPKTLCNACGVRYKSGRLVPEYRPAASPTFVLTKHSNSHRKVLELRRQKEAQRAQQHQQQFLHHQNMMFDVSNGGGGDDYLIHQHIGPDYRQLI